MDTGVPRADAAAASVGACDLFVLRRVTDERFVHFGGSGRGAGWAGLIEVATDESQVLRRTLATRTPVRLPHAEHRHVFGPYWATGAAFVPVTGDLVVVLGAENGELDAASDEALGAAATMAADAVGDVTPAKRLADELEELEAVQAALAVPTDDLPGALQALGAIAAERLACEVAVVYLADGDRLAVVDEGRPLGARRDGVARALRTILEEGRFPYCVQDAGVVPLPAPLDGQSGIRSYYVLELQGLARGILLVAHTDAAPRGFTLLCRRLGLRLAEVASAQFGAALTREWCRTEDARLAAEFARLTSTL